MDVSRAVPSQLLEVNSFVVTSSTLGSPSSPYLFTTLYISSVIQSNPTVIESLPFTATFLPYKSLFNTPFLPTTLSISNRNVCRRRRQRRRRHRLVGQASKNGTATHVRAKYVWQVQFLWHQMQVKVASIHANGETRAECVAVVVSPKVATKKARSMITKVKYLANVFQPISIFPCVPFVRHSHIISRFNDIINDLFVIRDPMPITARSYAIKDR